MLSQVPSRRRTLALYMLARALQCYVAARLAAFAAIANGCHELTALHVDTCAGISDESLAKLAQQEDDLDGASVKLPSDNFNELFNQIDRIDRVRTCVPRVR